MLQLFINDRYSDLCKQLGDAFTRRCKLDTLINDLQSEIDGLNDSQPYLIASEHHHNIKLKKEAEAKALEETKKALADNDLSGGV